MSIAFISALSIRPERSLSYVANTPRAFASSSGVMYGSGSSSPSTTPKWSEITCSGSTTLYSLSFSTAFFGFFAAFDIGGRPAHSVAPKLPAQPEFQTAPVALQRATLCTEMHPSLRAPIWGKGAACPGPLRAAVEPTDGPSYVPPREATSISRVAAGACSAAVGQVPRQSATSPERTRAGAILPAAQVPPSMQSASHTSVDNSEASTVVDGAAVASVPHPEHSISGASSGKFPMNWGQTGSCGSTQVCGVRGFFKPPR